MNDTNQTPLKELVEQSGFTITHLAENVLKCQPSYLSACLSQSKKLSGFREMALRNYIERVKEIPTV
jgi:uncharacterized Rmd1/YagE family protein